MTILEFQCQNDASRKLRQRNYHSISTPTKCQPTLAAWYLKSSATRIFVQHVVQTDTKENIKAPHLLIHLWGESLFPFKRTSDAENISVSWHHRAIQLPTKFQLQPFFFLVFNSNSGVDPSCVTRGVNSLCNDRINWPNTRYATFNI